MTYSSTDFTSNLVNYLFDNGMIDAAVVDSDDLEHQATEAMAAISNLAQRVTAPLALAAGAATADSTSARNARSAVFMDELLAEHETLTAVGEQHGMHTLADCMYLLSAIQKGTSISVEYPSKSKVVEVVQSLPSTALWMTFVHEVTE